MRDWSPDVSALADGPSGAATPFFLRPVPVCSLWPRHGAGPGPKGRKQVAGGVSPRYRRLSFSSPEGAKEVLRPSAEFACAIFTPLSPLRGSILYARFRGLAPPATCFRPFGPAQDHVIHARITYRLRLGDTSRQIFASQSGNQ